MIMVDVLSGRSAMKLFATLVVLLFGLGAALPALQASSAAVDPYYRMVVGVAQEPDSLNIFAMTLSISYTINFLVYDTLNSIEPDFTAGPQLADSWETSADNLNWTFHLNENAMWHDGVPVTADDVVFTFKLMIDNKKEAALWIDYLSNITGVWALDEHTVAVLTDVPKATMLTMMVPILPKHIWQSIPIKNIDKVDPFSTTYFPDGRPVGSGPLILDSWDSTRGEIVMYKNENYHIDTVKVDEVFFKTFGDETVMVTAMWNAEIDVAMDVPASLWADTVKRTELGHQETAALSFYELGVNCASAEWRESFPHASTNLETTNLSVRQAIAMATNKDDIVNRIFKGLAEKGESIIPTATPFWHYNVPEEDVWDYNIAGANALLDAAGYIDGPDTDTFRENSTSGVELDFSLYYRKGYKDEKASAESIRTSLLEIGINARLEEVSEGVLWNVWLDLQWDLFIWGWDTDVDPNFMLSVFTISQYPLDPLDSTKWGDALWVNETYEQMYLDQQVAVDVTERQAIVHDMQKLLYYECPYIVLYYPKGLHAYDNVEYTNFPDMETYPGTTPGTMWFFFAVTPTGAVVDTRPPENVEAGDDQFCTVGETLFFEGSATDEDTLQADLNWTWTFREPDETANVSYGQSVSYKFEQLGDVTVTLTVTDLERQSGTDSLVVNVTQVSETAGWLRGVVEDQGSAPLSGAKVNASGMVRLTDDDGAYLMPLEPGEYTVLASKEGYTSGTEEVTIATDETTWANFTLTVTAGILDGIVRDAETDEIVASAKVTVTYGTTVRQFTTDSEGYYQFLSVPEGAVSVNVSKAGYEANVTDATIVAGQTTTLDIYLTPLPEDDGLGSLALILAGIAILAVIVLAAIYMLRKKKRGGDMEPPPPDGEAPLA